jgi:hypothetical protein
VRRKYEVPCASVTASAGVVAEAVRLKQQSRRGMEITDGGFAFSPTRGRVGILCRHAPHDIVGVSDRSYLQNGNLGPTSEG